MYLPPAAYRRAGIVWASVSALIVAAGLAVLACGAEPRPVVPVLDGFKQIPAASRESDKPLCVIRIDPKIEPYRPIVATLELPPNPPGKPDPGVLIFWDTLPVPGTNTSTELEYREFDAGRTLCGWAKPGVYRLKVKVILIWWDDKTFMQFACAADVAIRSPEPPPVGNLTATPEEIAKGESSRLEWTATGATSARDQDGATIPVAGEKDVRPQTTTAYRVTWDGPGGTAEASKTVRVLPFPAPTAQLTVTPSTCYVGETITRTWKTTNADTATINDVPVSPVAEGSDTVTATAPGKLPQVLKATGRGGAKTDTQTVTVKEAEAPIPVAGLHVLIVHDLVAGPLPVDQQPILTSDYIRAYLRKNCAKDSAGWPAFKVIASTSDLSRMDKVWRDAFSKYKDKLKSPAWIVSNHPKGGVVGPLPATVDAAGAVLAQWTGVPWVRGPPAAAEPVRLVGEADIGDGKLVFVDGHARPLRCKAKPKDYRPRLRGCKSFAEAGLSLIPESEWKPRLDALIRDKARLQDMITGAGIGANDQNGYGLCWMFAGVGSHQIRGVVQNNRIPLISAASCSGNIYPSDWGVNGGWPGEAVEYISSSGGVHCDLWPMLGLSKKYSTTEAEADRVNHRNVTYVELGGAGGMWKEYVSCVLQGVPICVTYSWWSHAVTGGGIEASGNDFNSVIWNSWGDSYGTKGWAAITGSRKVPDEAYGIIETTHAECRSPAAEELEAAARRLEAYAKEHAPIKPNESPEDRGRVRIQIPKSHTPAKPSTSKDAAAIDQEWTIQYGWQLCPGSCGMICAAHGGGYKWIELSRQKKPSEKK